MRKGLLLSLGLSLGGLVAQAQPLVLVNETFQNRSNLSDLTLLTPWGFFGTPTSAFDLEQKADNNGLTYSAIVNSDSSLRHNGYQLENSLRAATAFDVLFPTIDRSDDTVTVEFDVIWGALSNGGQNARVVCALLHDVPTRPLQFGDVDSVQLTAPFGRPAYSFRVLNRNPQGTNNYANMMYGGGRDTLGEFEKYSASNPTRNWWLPGFISGPGGVAPEGTNDGYPLNRQGVRRSRGGTLASATRWKHYKLVLMPERMEFYSRNSSDPASSEVLEMFMHLPKPKAVADMVAELNAVHGTSETTLPVLYNYFPELQGVRLYFAAGAKTWLANLKVEATEGTPQVGLAGALRTLPLRMWPNPARESLRLALQLDTDAQVQLVNQLGQNQSVVWNGSELNTASLAPGVYFLRVRQAGKTYAARFVKE